MGVLLRTNCECSFTSMLVSGVTWAGDHAPYYCASCRTFGSESIPIGAPRRDSAASTCGTCGSVTEALDLQAANCPCCEQRQLVFSAVALVP